MLKEIKMHNKMKQNKSRFHSSVIQNTTLIDFNFAAKILYFIINKSNRNNHIKNFYSTIEMIVVFLFFQIQSDHRKS